MSAGVRLDLHVHSSWSPDGRDDLEHLVAQATAVGLDGLALTDHNTVRGHAALEELRQRHRNLRLLPGVEVSTRDGHLLAYGVRELPPRGLSVEATAEWVVAHGGVPVLAHPFRWVHGVGAERGRSVPVPALEAVNGHTGIRANERAQRLAQGRRLGTTGGSDAHSGGDVGRAWTIFPEGAETPDDLLQAIGRGGTVGQGRGAPPLAQVQLSLRSLLLRTRRGFRAI